MDCVSKSYGAGNSKQEERGRYINTSGSYRFRHCVSSFRLCMCINFQVQKYWLILDEISLDASTMSTM
jgi:hypothetical protein